MRIVEEPRNRLGGAIAAALVRQVAVLVVNLAIVVLIARALGPAGNGEYSLALLLPLFLSTFLNIGLPSSNAYFIGRDRATAGGVLRSTLVLWAVVVVAGAIIGSIVLFNAHAIFPEVPKGLLLLALAVFPAVLLNLLLASLLQGLQAFRRVNTVALVAPLVQLGTVIALLPASNNPVGDALIAYGLGQFSGVLTALWFLKSFFRPAFPTVAPISTISYLSYAWKAHVANLVAFANYRADAFLLNLFLEPAAVGVYVVAIQIAERLWFLSQVVAGVSLPRLSELHASAIAANLAPLLARWVVTGTLAGAIGAAVMGWPVIRLLFGAPYVNAYFVLLVLLPGIVLASGSKMLANDIAARGRPMLNAGIALVSIVVTIILALLCIPALGIFGAAVAMSASYVVQWALTTRAYTELSAVTWRETVWITVADVQWLKKGFHWRSDQSAREG